MTPDIQGIIPVLATPFDESGRVDFAGFAEIVEMAIQDGANALAAFGLAGEYYKLEDTEREALAAVLIGTARKRVPVILSITHHATEVAVIQARRAQEMGADALMVLPPFFLGPPPSAVLAHMEAILTTVRIPVMLQYAPGQTGSDASLLSRVPVSMVKVDCFPSTPTLLSIPEHVRKYVGYMGLDLPDAFAAGCAGCMPTASLANVFVKLWQRLRAHDLDCASNLHARMLPLLQFMMHSIEGLIACEKQLLFRKGLIRSPYCRKPAATLDKTEIDRLYRHADDL